MSSAPAAHPVPASARASPADSKKKKRNKRKAALKSEEDNKKAKPEEVVAQAPVVQQKLIKDEELHCIVCFDFPAGGEIYQCKHGHLLCKACHQQVIEGEKAQCPSCRVRLSRENPARNRIAELVLSSLMVDCSNDGCKTQAQFSEVTKHEQEQCGFRAAQCKWEVMGCEWKGVHNQVQSHEASCDIKDKSARKLLKLATKRNLVKLEEQKKIQDTYIKQAQVCQLLSSRCRDVAVRDVHIEPDTLAREKCSKTFTALGLAWEAVLAPQPAETKEADSRVGIFLRIVSAVKRKVILKLFVLKGPGCMYDLPPSSYKIMFKRKKRKSEVFYLPFEPFQAFQVMSMDTLCLRMGFVDVSSGRVCRGFTSLNDGSGSRSSEDETSSSGTDYDEYDLDQALRGSPGNSVGSLSELEVQSFYSDDDDEAADY